MSGFWDFLLIPTYVAGLIFLVLGYRLRVSSRKSASTAHPTGPWSPPPTDADRRRLIARRRERFVLVVAGAVAVGLTIARAIHDRVASAAHGRPAAPSIPPAKFVHAAASGMAGMLAIAAVLLSLTLAVTALVRRSKRLGLLSLAGFAVAAVLFGVFGYLK